MELNECHLESLNWKHISEKQHLTHDPTHIVIYCLTMKNNALNLYFLLGAELEYPRHVIRICVALMNVTVLSQLQKDCCILEMQTSNSYFVFNKMIVSEVTTYS